MRDQKEVLAEELKNEYPAQHFNDTCKEGYDLLTNVLKYNMLPRDGETEQERRSRAKRCRNMKILAIEILEILFNSTYDGVLLFMANKEA